MFKKFSPSSDIASQTPPKSSVQRSIRAAVLAQWKLQPEVLEQIWPKKETLTHVKCREHISIYTVCGEPLFFQHFDGPFFPTLRLLHKYPFILPKVGVDRGAIRFLLAGAHMMCPGLTSAGGYLPPAECEIPANALVAVHAEGKEHAVAVGITKLGTEDMRKVNKGIGVEIATHLGDDFRSISALFDDPQVDVFMQGSGGPFAYDTFTRVNPRKKRKGKHASTTPFDAWTRVKEELASDGRWSLCCREMFQKALCDGHIEPHKALCLGLGSPSSSRDARAQLALLCDLCVASNIGMSNVFVYDPVFTETDGQLFRTLGMQCLDHTEGAKHSVDRPTILYMPHCDLKLYERVIHANWALDGLCNIIFLANHFGDYVDNNVASKLEEECPCLLRLGTWVGNGQVFDSSHEAVPLVECRPLPMSHTFPSAFNNLSIQYVTRASLLLQGDGFWKTKPFNVEQHV